MLASRPWLLGGLIVTAAGFAGCDSEPTMYLSDRMKGTAPRCAEAFSRELPATPAAMGSVQGLAVAFRQVDHSRIDMSRRYDFEKEQAVFPWHSDLGFDLLPSRLSAMLEERVKAVVCVREISTEIGMYVPASPDPNKPTDVAAHREDWDVRVMSWPSAELIAGKYFQGPDPPMETQAPADQKSRRSGGPPRAEAHQWLNALFAP